MTIPEPETVKALCERLRLYGQSQRLLILIALLQGERSVGELEAITSVQQPALSQQLAELRRAEIVATRRVSRAIFYSIGSDREARALSAFLASFCVGDTPEPVGTADDSSVIRVGAAQSGDNRASGIGAAKFAVVRVEPQNG